MPADPTRTIGHKVQLPRPPATPPSESPGRAGRLPTQSILIMPATAPQVKVDAVKFFFQSAGDLQQDVATGHKVQLLRPPAALGVAQACRQSSKLSPFCAGEFTVPPDF